MVESSPKAFKTYNEQIALLRSRGMRIDDEGYARAVLEQVNYYRLSGYWYSLRRMSDQSLHRCDEFVEGTSFEQVTALYDFDERLRSQVFQVVSIIELALRALLGHVLGRIDPQIHLNPNLLGSLARAPQSAGEPSADYNRWLGRYRREIGASREDFVAHHNETYGGRLPIWAAVEVMDFGLLNYLYRLSPDNVREDIAARVQLTPAQLGSWIKSLNIVRNYSAHHARMFNRVYVLQPRLPRPGTNPGLDAVRGVMNRCFGQLTLIQHFIAALDLRGRNVLPEVLATYPTTVAPVPISHIGAPQHWQELLLWRTNS
ncbi:CAAX protease [Corynebacterium phocae]|uniref:CAAX protease n=1 Tax=Corynebacterium phocae TaxID=161895 RepID=A0A1L7D0T4_9CORY|nr:Abi family protein [Corynebacterium phocae]APT91688.1 CAAX protease [Corynebacterium phocae]KAA8728596.1 Abi family protein [Corynebacterium phocae]